MVCTLQAGVSLLMVASLAGHHKVVELLVEAGATINVQAKVNL